MSCENEHFHGHSHGNGDDSDHVPPTPTLHLQLLNLKIDLVHVTALNLGNHQDDLSRLFKSEQDRFSVKPVIRSDADEQLILHIPFLNGLVKLHLVILRTNGTDYCPHSVLLWKNSPSIDFDAVDSVKPLFALTHPHVGVCIDDDELPDVIDDHADFVEHHLPRHKFSGVHHLTMFFKDLHSDEDELRLHLIELRGEFTPLSKDPVISLYELAPNPADHKTEIPDAVGFRTQ